MGNLHESITDDLKAFAESQPVFFVATAPNNGGHVNVSPKGLEPVVVLGPHEVAYIDRIGSELVWRGRTAAPPIRIANMTVAGE